MNSTIKFLIYFFVLSVVSCTESTDMLTVINPDGSCYREFTATADSAFMAGDTATKHNPFPVVIDSRSGISWKYGNSGLRTDFPVKKSVLDSIIKLNASRKLTKNDSLNKKDKHLCFSVIARLKYSSVEDMSVRFKLKPSYKWSKMKVKYSLEKRFRWFYTYYSYRETYPKIKTGFELPIEKYMTKDEALFWFTGKPNMLQGMNGVEIRSYVGGLEDKYNKWFAHNNWNKEYKVLIDNYDQINIRPVTKERLELMRDTLFNSCDKDLPDFKMEKSLNKYFKTTAFSVLWKGENSPMKKIENKLNNRDFIEYFSEQFNYRLIMPGKTTPPGDAVMQGDTILWKLTAYRMVPNDFTIEAQSRKANIWAFILTGLILIIAIGSFFWKPKK
jgi:hypothetical protein